MRQDQEISSPENFAFFTFVPFVVFYELKYIVHIQSLFKLDLVFTLHFTYYSDKVE